MRTKRDDMWDQPSMQSYNLVIIILGQQSSIITQPLKLVMFKQCTIFENNFQIRCLLLLIYLSISPGISKIRNHSSNILGRCPPTCINHYQKLHQILICRRTCRLHKIYITPSDTFLQLNIYLSISKAFYLNLSKFQTHVACNFLLKTQDYIRNSAFKVEYMRIVWLLLLWQQNNFMEKSFELENFSNVCLNGKLPGTYQHFLSLCSTCFLQKPRKTANIIRHVKQPS